MTAESRPLQGNLFVESQNKLLNTSSLQNTNNLEDSNVNEESLIKDAKTRPRKRKQSQEKLKISLDSQKNDSNDELRSWTHHSQVDKSKLTTVLRHYVDLKTKNPDRVLLYRLGDFFECFFEDAINLSQILELTLTSKEGGKTIGRVPMAGIPHHASERYCSTLIQKGYSVAICDQLESIANKEGKLLKRGITRILTPGTILEEGMLQAKKNNWLAAVVIEKNSENTDVTWGLASADISTGEFIVKEGNDIDFLEQDLLNIEASEIIFEQLEDKIYQKWKSKNIKLTQKTKTSFSLQEAKAILKKHYKITSVDGLGLNELKLSQRAAGGLLGYLYETNPITIKTDSRTSPVNLEFPKINFSTESLIIDSQTRRNLEITKTQRDGQFQGSLLWAIDHTLTAMGGRCLRRWLENPLVNTNEILARQNIVSLLVEKRSLRQVLRNLLRAMGDLERLSGRASAGQAGGRDLIAIADSLQKLPNLSSHLKTLSINLPNWLSEIKDIDPKLLKIAHKIKNELIDNPPLNITEGNLIYDGVDPILDGLRNQLDDQNQWLSSQELKERENSGNNNLKLQYHRTFGYFLAVRKSKANNVPQHWIRRQTLANEERFITPELKEREGKILYLKLKVANREYELFCKLREEVGKFAQSIRKTSKAIASLDVISGLAQLAATNNYCAPNIINNKQNSSRSISIKKCRHPVVEQILVEEVFQPNDIEIGKDNDLIILTGPNASGKSCYLRQVGLVQILSQIGSWVPAEEATISIADKLFTRVGAVDDLAAGQSTFMVEMTETAFILNQATERSLVLLDEIGRGTSTFDGLSIAWSVSEFLAEKIRSRTIFATHYHELNDLSKQLENVINYQVLVKETGEELSFLHQVIPGGSNRSYGIEAARLAGVPQKVISRARTILQKLETKNSN